MPAQRRAWSVSPRQKLWQALEALDYPTTRQERWKYTRVSQTAQHHPYGVRTPSGSSRGRRKPRCSCASPLWPANTSVETTLDEGAEGCFVGPVSVALERYPERLKAWSNSAFATQEWFAALQASRTPRRRVHFGARWPQVATSCLGPPPHARRRTLPSPGTSSTSVTMPLPKLSFGQTTPPMQRV